MTALKAMKPRHMLLGAALLGAAALVLFGDRAPDDGVAEAVVRPAAAPTAAVSATAAPPAAVLVPTADPKRADTGKRQPILALVPRDVLIADNDSGFGQVPNGAVFGSQSWVPPPPPPTAAQAAPPPPPPMAPPLPFTFIGKSVGDGVWEVYLARGDRTYTARTNEVIDGTYRVDAIAPPILRLTYLPLNQVQQLNIGVFE
ncbi:hypothetical protein [Herbaspirillum sp. SJZ107]|uniref:hypothetical protein n=1 Tax=Herbaspirillum sp. SJZ107 TaxID=2572881 RepID=UPI00114DE8B9|nr:hypothetical protein [Herbaspirillum sp. SJZ107]TQK10568.1 hypothetical protein FBX97_0486 [Herbaspirillum sp. SJZ107]